MMTDFFKKCGRLVIRLMRGKNPPAGKQRSISEWVNIASAAGIVGLLLSFFVVPMVGIGVDSQDNKCLPGTIYFLSKIVPKERDLHVGAIYHFTIKKPVPIINESMVLMKKVAALPGDRVDVDADGIRINGRKWGDLNSYLLAKSGLTLEDVSKSYVVAEGEVLMLGTLERSFDGRYFGPIESRWLLGRGYWLI